MPRRAAFAGAAVLLLALAAYVAWPTLRGAAFIVQAASLGGTAESAARRLNRPVAEFPLTIPSRYGSLRARVYRPRGARRAIVLTPGVHMSGIDEPRLVKLARDLSAEGLLVVTPELPDLVRYMVTARETDMIEDAAAWVASDARLAPDHRVGLVGISFAGGLSVVAAGRAALRDRAAYVLSFGGHGDLPRVLRYLCTGVQPDGSRRPPHDYGVVVFLLGAADRVVPPAQVEPLREGMLTFLRASSYDMWDKRRAAAEFARALAMEATLPEPSRTLLHAVNGRDVKALGTRLLPYVEAFGGDRGLSPERSSAPGAPVYLLHGSDDNVIPAIESTLLARHLRDATRVHHLITPLITHAEVDRPSAALDVWRLIRFWSSALDQ